MLELPALNRMGRCMDSIFTQLQHGASSSSKPPMSKQLPTYLTPLCSGLDRATRGEHCGPFGDG